MKEVYPIPEVDKWPKVAILYLTKDDFNECALMRCLAQDYDNYNVFIVDDSIGLESRLKIDNFVENCPDKIRLIRRSTHEGYKAGNLNYALSLIERNFPYFVVCDADTYLPDSFLKRLMPYFQIDNDIGFIQANHRCYNNENSSFAHDFFFTEDVYWRYYMSCRERYGFTMFHGRGAIIKTECWREVGGFPYSLTEDLVFSCRLRERGYRGIFIPRVICYEKYPQDYIRYRRRYSRWIQGTTNYITREFPRLLCNRNIKWYEKIDILTSGINLAISIPLISYILLIGIAFPIFYYKYTGYFPLFHRIFCGDSVLNFITSWSRYYYYIWTWDFYLVATLISILQLIPILGVLKKDPAVILRRISLFIGISFGSVITNSIRFFMGLLGVESPFQVSGAPKIRLNRIEKYLFLIEVITGLGLFIISLITINIWILSISFSIILTPLLVKFGWDSGFIKTICYFPLIFFLISIILLGIFIY